MALFRRGACARLAAQEETHEAGLHRRRFHQRDRPRQQPGARRHAQRADHRRAGAAAGGAEAVVVVRSSRAPFRPPGGGASLAALRWLREHGAQQIYFKVCSTFDSHRPRQHRPGHRGADGRAGLRFHDRLLRPSWPTAARSSGLSLHRRGAAQRGQHARTSADADDRPQPRARDAAPVPAPRRPDRHRRGAARQRGDRRAHGGAARRRHRHRDRRRADDADLRDGRAPSPRCRCSPPARAWRSACQPTSASRPAPRRPNCRPGRRTGDRLGSCSAASNAQVAASGPAPWARLRGRPAAPGRRRRPAAAALAWAGSKAATSLC